GGDAFGEALRGGREEGVRDLRVGAELAERVDDGGCLESLAHAGRVEPDERAAGFPAAGGPCSQAVGGTAPPADSPGKLALTSGEQGEHAAGGPHGEGVDPLRGRHGQQGSCTPLDRQQRGREGAGFSTATAFGTFSG